MVNIKNIHSLSRVVVGGLYRGEEKPREKRYWYVEVSNQNDTVGSKTQASKYVMLSQA
jgi:hypothetical protein